MENDDLVAIADLSHINNQRQVVQAVEAFRKIMSKNKPPLEEGKEYPSVANPLLPGTVSGELASEQVIRTDATIFAVFSALIDDAIIQQEKYVEEKKMDRAANFAEQKKVEFSKKKEEFIGKYD